MRFPELPGWLRTRLMFALIITAALAFGVRFNDLLSRASHAEGLSVSDIEPAAGEGAEGGVTPPSAAAAPSVSSAPDAPLQAAQASNSPAPGASASGGGNAPAGETAADVASGTEWRDAGDSEMEYSAVQMQLFEDLSKRRRELEAQEKKLATREALLKAAERNLEQKYKELSDLRTEVQDILEQQKEEEEARIASLVKIYEGMKAKDAARIFDTLDMDVLLQVIGRMSERKSAPVIAAMNPERARSVTIMLAEQKALPTLDDALKLQ